MQIIISQIIFYRYDLGILLTRV